MLDFILKYWLEFVFGIIALGMTAVARHFYKIVKENKNYHHKDDELERDHKTATAINNLRDEITEVLKYGKDKLIAGPTPQLGKAAVVFPTSDAVSIYSWFAEKCNAGFIYSKYSDWEIGKDIAPKAKGDKVTLNTLRNLPNSSRNFDVDEEGAPIYDMTVLEENSDTILVLRINILLLILI